MEKTVFIIILILHFGKSAVLTLCQDHFLTVLYKSHCEYDN